MISMNCITRALGQGRVMAMRSGLAVLLLLLGRDTSVLVVLPASPYGTLVRITMTTKACTLPDQRQCQALSLALVV